MVSRMPSWARPQHRHDAPTGGPRQRRRTALATPAGKRPQHADQVAQPPLPPHPVPHSPPLHQLLAGCPPVGHDGHTGACSPGAPHHPARTAMSGPLSRPVKPDGAAAAALGGLQVQAPPPHARARSTPPRGQPPIPPHPHIQPPTHKARHTRTKGGHGHLTACASVPVDQTPCPQGYPSPRGVPRGSALPPAPHTPPSSHRARHTGGRDQRAHATGSQKRKKKENATAAGRQPQHPPTHPPPATLPPPSAAPPPSKRTLHGACRGWPPPRHAPRRRPAP